MHVSITFAANRACVEVDQELGLVRVVQIDVAQDVGHLVNPIQAYGQISGGCVQGMGLALMEHLDYQRGAPGMRTGAVITCPPCSMPRGFRCSFWKSRSRAIRMAGRASLKRHTWRFPQRWLVRFAPP